MAKNPKDTPFEPWLEPDRWELEIAPPWTMPGPDPKHHRLPREEPDPRDFDDLQLIDAMTEIFMREGYLTTRERQVLWVAAKRITTYAQALVGFKLDLKPS